MRRYEIYSRRKRHLVRLADGLLAPLSWFKSTGRAAAPERLLVVRTAYLGDVVMALPALRALRRRFPATHVTVLTSRAGVELLAPEGIADRLRAYEPPWFYGRGPRPLGASLRELRELWGELRGERYDAAVDLRGDLREIALILARSGAARLVSYDFAGGGPLLTDVVPCGPDGGRRHKIDVMLAIAEHLGAEPAPPRFGLAPRPAGRARAAELLGAAGIRGPYLLAHMGTRVALKRYERFPELVGRLVSETGLPVAVVPEGMDLRPGGAAILDGGISVDALIELVRGARALVCHDSAPWHVAQAVGTPACAIFGPSKPRLTGLYPGRPGAVVSADLPCRDVCDEAVCRLGKVPKQCLAELDPARIVAAVQALLEGPPPIRQRDSL